MIYETPELQQAFDQGAHASCVGQSKHANPYPGDSYRAVTWNRGFDYAREAAPRPPADGGTFWFAPGAVGRHAPRRRLSFAQRSLLAAMLAAVLSAVLVFCLGYFNPGGLFR